MKRISVTDANREFTKVTKEVDKEGTVTLTKQGKDMYVVMTKARYNETALRHDMLEKMSEGLWGKAKNKAYKVSAKGKEAEICEIAFTENGEPELLIVTHCPVEGLSFKDGETLEIKVRPVKGFRQEMTEVWYMDEGEDEILKEYDEQKTFVEMQVLYPMDMLGEK